MNFVHDNVPQKFNPWKSNKGITVVIFTVVAED